ncbi:helix-turn-helix transcriptional regulator [Mucilaginibacter rubeus]|uniref:Helix-turn-helix transcriptional regulator n=1 Tax=Mucilaginibacter rubeus TaxID=2027860 RepID=A0AAE6JLZ7_9SPHI|nr:MULTISPECIES: helix-turn-helix domain-containing protein [Mucilaginibacter]QEM07185.1 helix-turn-helix transcriptional regulator [Mucilaginibacter rubeus]QEM19641.1 helix-turn-helix transcriptional regulator [Mucilaginibacter gossypii]QTE43665.1 helix-turn-helix transcriptional regulator [Mucilaginibacter rubeus]QTE50265.1 helix-turn-helix transcriptional regulator [Mucilaginibacter rubeus]QTE55352.1 helix-turn-helix transcriptional regulator [Mucilaginibacter rubeus]
MKNVNTITQRSNCPISFSLDFIGDKWSLLIIRDMMLFEKSTYSDFLNSQEKIASNIARDRLIKLTEHGFISRSGSQARHWNRPYKLTEKAFDLIPVIVDLTLWGLKYGPFGTMEHSGAMETKNRTKLIADIEQKLRAQGVIKAIAY